MPTTSGMVVTLNPPTLNNANNIWQGGNPKPTHYYHYRFITAESKTFLGSITSGTIIQSKGSITL